MTESTHSGFSFWVAVCFAINLIIGGGILIIPHAVVKSGVILGPITVGVMVYLCDAAKDFLLGALARGEELYSLGFAAAAKRRRRKMIEAKEGHKRVSSGALSPRKKRRRNQRQPLLAPVSPTAPAGAGAALEGAAGAPAPAERLSDSDSEAPDGPLYLRKHVMEVTELTKLLFGNTARYAYLTVMALWTLGTMWSFGSVFGASLANHIPIVFMPEPHNQTCDMNADPENCRPQYMFYVFVFGLVVVPLTLMDMTEQVAVQVVMAAGRIVLVCIMSGTVLAAWTCDGVAFKLMAREAPDGSLERDPPPLFDSPIDFSGLSILIPVAVTAAAFHQAIPSITRDTAEKWDMHKVLRAAFIIVGVCYVIFGILLALFFGEHIEPQATLLWADYVGCADVSDVHSSAGLNGTLPLDTAAGGRILLLTESVSAAAKSLKPSGWAQFVTLFVLLFPAADVASAFPLNAIALANNFLSMKYDLQPPKKDKDAELNALLAGGGVLPVESSDSPAMDLTDNAVARDVSVPSADATGGELAINQSATESGALAMPVAEPEQQDKPKEHPLAHIPKWARVTAKLMAALPPIVGACIVSDLDKIQQVNGSLAVFLVYTAPPLLWMGSRGALVLASASTEPEDEETGFKGKGPVGSLISLQDWMVTQWWRYVPTMVAGSRAEERAPLVANGVKGGSTNQRYAPLDSAAPVDESAEGGMLSMQMGRTESSAGVVGGDTPVMPGGPTVAPDAAYRMGGDDGDRSCFGGTLRMLVAGTMGHRGFDIFVSGGGDAAGRRGGAAGARRSSGATLDSDSSGEDAPTKSRSASVSSADGVTLAEAEAAADTIYEPACMRSDAGPCTAKLCALAPGVMAGGSLVLWSVVVVLVVSGWFQ